MNAPGEPVDVLVVGGGGREHALAWKLARSPRAGTVYVAPGNAGTAVEPGVENIALGAGQTGELVAFARAQRIGLAVIGPEAPLVDGIVDAFTAAGLACFGPTQDAARLEGSKTFAKEFLGRHGIPTAAWQSFTEPGPALAYLETLGLPAVIKADGLAAGKGVVIAATREEGRAAIRDMLSENRFGAAGHRVVVEEFLAGEEASFICMVDGRHVLPMASSQDHKAAHDGDRGPNTGGMGAYSPAPVIDDALHAAVLREVMEPTVAALADAGTPYTGFLYAGLMIGPDRVPRVLEFNCRFGDPETQPVLMRLESDLLELCLLAVDGRLDRADVRWDPRTALGVVLAAEGYPGPVDNGRPITGLDADPGADARIFHAGTAREGEATVTAGGRVLCATALGDGIADAARRAYALAGTVHWDGCWYRRDIGHLGLARTGGAG